jgi:hypothetical protein
MKQEKMRRQRQPVRARERERERERERSDELGKRAACWGEGRGELRNVILRIN